MAVNIKRLREAKGWTQDELAAKTALAQSRISKYERGTKPDIRSALKLAAGLSVSIDELLHGEFEPYDLSRPSEHLQGSALNPGGTLRRFPFSAMYLDQCVWNWNGELMVLAHLN